MSDDTDWADYETGPFCRHWGDPSNCDEVCQRCQHKCTDHDFEDGDCSECDCAGWQDANEPELNKGPAK